MQIIGQYVNGNHITSIWKDGTRIQETVNPEDSKFIFEYPESFDFKINDRCSNNCPWCHENSTENGLVPSLSEFVQSTFYQSIPPYIEMAIGGGNIFESPDLEVLLESNKYRDIISNITVDQITLVKRFTEIRRLIKEDKIKGLGISLSYPTAELSLAVDSLNYDNIVIHAIAGNLTKDMIEFLYGKKVLILGYKIFERGKDYYLRNKTLIDENIEWLKDILPSLKDKVKTLSFDCLGIKQLDIRKTLSVKEDDWNIRYQGDDTVTRDDKGNIVCSSMYVDLPDMNVARTSTSIDRFPLDLSKSLCYNFQKTLSTTANMNNSRLPRQILYD